MKLPRRIQVRNFIFALWILTIHHPFAQSVAISYQGRLSETGKPATGGFDLQFKLFDTAEAGVGVQKGETRVHLTVPVTNGLFTVTLDFGAAVFDGSPRFLEISVRPGGSAIPYTLLTPRQQVTSVPYAIQSLNAGKAATAAIATTVASGAALQSLNNLKDNVVLAAGANVTITPSGNTLTIASTGGGGSSLWNASSSDTFYDKGNVGIGTAVPNANYRLSVIGATLLNPANGFIQFASPNAELGMSITPNVGNRADLRFDGSVLKLVAAAGVLPPSAANGLAISTAGNVGIGVSTTPNAAYRLEVKGSTLLSPVNGFIQFASPNAELGMSITPNAGNRADLRFDGSVLKLVASTGVVPPSAANGLAITTAGRVGIGTTAPDAKLHVETTQPGTVVYGHALGASGVGVYGNAPNPGGIGALGSAGAGSIGVYAGNTAGGTAVHAEGNATQARDKGGFVKAMAYIDPFLPPAQYVVRSYNSQPGAAVTFTRAFAGAYTINFGFNVEGRFISLTPQASTTFPPTLVGGYVTSVAGSQVHLAFVRTGGGSEDLQEDSRFHIIVY